MYFLKAREWRKFEVARKLQRRSILRPGSIADTTHVCVCVTTYEDLTKAHGYKHLIGGSARGGGVVWGCLFQPPVSPRKTTHFHHDDLNKLMKRSESPKIT